MESNRRDFITLSAKAILAAGTVVGGGLLIREGTRESITRPGGVLQRKGPLHYPVPTFNGPDIAIAEGPSPARITRAAIVALGGMGRFIKPGDTVGIKPNVGWSRSPAHGSNTHPDVVGELVRLCKKAGAKRVIVSDVTVNDPLRCFSLSGIKKASIEAGGEIILPSKRHFEEHDLKGSVLHQWKLLTPVLNVDKLINVPVAKHHGLSKLTGAMKNWIGVLGGVRNQLHQDINGSIADLADYIRPTLTVLDANRIVFRNGPQGGSLSDVKQVRQVLATTDQVAADAYAATLLGLKAEQIPYILMAAKRKIGRAELTEKRMIKVGRT